MKTPMKTLLKSLILVSFLALLPSAALADAYDLTFKPITELTTTTTAPASGDKKIIYEASTGNVKVYDATAEKLTGSFNGTVGATTPSTGSFTSIVASSTITGGASSNIAINTNKFTVAASSGNTIVAGTLGVTGALTASGGVDGILGGVTPAAATVTTLTSTTANGTTINAGASGTAGSFNVFPTTASNGKLIISAINNSGAFNSTITNKNIGQATVYSLDDAGAATANIVNDVGAQTLSSKTLTAPVVNNPVISGPAPIACGSTCTLGASAKGTYVRMDTAAGSAVTLPTATGTGTVYRIYVSVANSSNQDKVLLATVTDTIIGTAIGENAGTAKVFVGNAGTYHSIQMPFAGTQPSGGFVGDTITCTDVASTVYKCDMMYQAGTTPTTPYNTGTT